MRCPLYNNYFTIDISWQIDFALNGRDVEELTQICHSSKAREIGKKIAGKLKEAIPRQLFEIAIQAKMEGRVLARENIRAYRKDVTAKLVSVRISELSGSKFQTKSYGIILRIYMNGIEIFEICL